MKWRRKILASSGLYEVEKKNLSFKQTRRSGQKRSSDSSRLDEMGRKKYIQAEWMNWTRKNHSSRLYEVQREKIIGSKDVTAPDGRSCLESA